MSVGRRDVLIAIGSSAVVSLRSPAAVAQQASRPAPDANLLNGWSAKAASLIPKLVETEQLPVNLVRAVAAPEAR